jgi:putative transposase
VAWRPHIKRLKELVHENSRLTDVCGPVVGECDAEGCHRKKALRPAERFMVWCAERGIELRYIQPRDSDQSAFIERFNRTYRTEVLNAYVFESLEQVREISAEWLQSYNEERPHDALAGLPPATYRAQLEAGSSPLIVSH